MSYENINGTRSYEDASELAFFELSGLIENELASAELLQKTIRTEMTETAFLLECDVVCLENIARDQPIGNN